MRPECSRANRTPADSQRTPIAWTTRASKHDQYHQTGQPDDKEQADVLECRQEAIVSEYLREIVEANEGAALREGEIDRVGRRKDTEGDQKDRVQARECEARFSLWARWMVTGLRLLGRCPPFAGWASILVPVSTS